ncbi:VCBS repeat-containing protein [Rhodocytophaga rosea]|uniref:VCBS repeat-containing protein n=1 Tax=Rhodocytophaga rosea TaxID=2704465 RepID=A0A6C0GQS7_9BACT|nr:VCBS repeat-containing protein [Rhodocytophaga rosea]QHT69860.1 VCBS repeat-containing protein [Rhodocytophaga rosea]
MKIAYTLVVSLLLLAACRPNNDSRLFELVPASETGITFANTITTSDSMNALNFDYIYNGGGVAVGDVNNDSLPDIYFTGNMVSGKLYLNKGNFQFEDITEKAGVSTTKWTTGVAMVDINTDGLLDLYVCVAGKDSTQSANLLFVSNGNGTFTEKAKEYGLADTGYSTQAAFFDYDNDGDLDMYLLTNAYENFNRNITRPKFTKGEGKSTDRLYRNNGDHTFTNVSKEAGILVEGYGLGVAVSDINQDGWPDVYVANDFLTNDLLWINNQNGTFTESAARYMKHQSHNGMGTDVADYNNDGLVDIVVLDMLPEDNLRQKTMFPAPNYDRFEQTLQYGYIPQYIRNTLQLNNGNGTFSEIGQLAGIHNTDWSWSALFADYDNDGLKDLLITNGYRKDVTNMDFITYSRENSMFGTDETNKKRMAGELDKLAGANVHNYIFRNKGDLTFEDKSLTWGMSEPGYSNGAAYADLDQDGDLDLVVNNIDQKASIYRNNADKVLTHTYLQIELIGTDLNKHGIGTKIELVSGGKKQFQEQTLYRGYKSTVDPLIHFGLGSITKVDTLTVTWPDGKLQQLYNVAAKQRLVIDYKQSKVPESVQVPAHIPSQTLFTNISGRNGLVYKHQESDYVDFKIQPLLPHKFSQNGPGIAVGDADGNGLDDVYVGGAAGKSGVLFFQSSSGTFESHEVAKQREEDMGSLFFDADKDGDLDLYVASGGSEFEENSAYYQDRLYVNDGKGNFTHQSAALPEMRTSGSCVTAADYDQDGDLDLFVGGRIVPGKYPMPARSYILQNNGGKFTDITAQLCQELQKPGLVTAALWTDFNNDNQIDLIVTGEWMPVSFFENKNGRLTNVTNNAGTAQATGWWNSLTSGDFDQDGDMDYVAGNLGLNTKYKASEKEPVCVYAKDYDQNGSIDPILCYYIMGENHPTHPRDALIDQINGMRGRFPRYEQYGKATLDKVLTKQELEGALVVRSEYFQSAYIENQGNGKFVMRPLPIQAQVAPVFGMLSRDFDGDGQLDVLLTGNSYAAEVQTGQYDASVGLLLKGDGKGDFSPVPVTKSGFFVNKDAKGIAELMDSKGNPLVLVACNADSLESFTYKSTTESIKLLPSDQYAILTHKNGKKSKQEFYYGSAYLSQSARVLKLSEDIIAATIYESNGKSRVVTIKAGLAVIRQP